MLIFIVALFAFFVPQALSVAQGQISEKKVSVKLASFEITGEAYSCNLLNSTIIVLSDSGEYLVISMNIRTVMSKDGKRIKIVDISKGDHVRVKYIVKDDKNIAKFLIVHPRDRKKRSYTG